MKKTIILLMVCALVLVAGSAFAGISSTKHNLTSSNSTSSIHTSDASATLCGFCHIPHGGNTGVSNAPLWGRQINAAPAYQTYGGGVTLGGTAVGQPGTNSLTCLSCHDGTIGLGVNFKNGQTTAGYAMVLGTGEPNYLSGNMLARNGSQSYEPMIAEGGTDLRNDHPVGLQYIAGRAGLDTLAGAKTTGYKFYGASQDQVECASCHDPHISTTTKFKRSVTAADFCVGCHINK